MKRRRPTWPELPTGVREGIEGRLGARVTGWTSHDGGYSPGLASVLETPAGRVFVKAVDVGHDVAARLYRQEAARASVLPEGVPAPAFRWLLEPPAGTDGGWVAVAFDAVDGRAPRVPWDAAELGSVVELAVRIAEHEVPAGSLPDAAAELGRLDRWPDLADERPAGLASYDPWLAAHVDLLADLSGGLAEAVAGPHLMHGDLRGDNTLLTARAAGARALAVDWPFAARGAAFCDLVGMLPAVQVEGGPDPETVLDFHPLPAATDPDAVTTYLAVLTGYFVHSSLQPPPPGIPHVRAFQRAQAEVCVPWLRHRLKRASW